MRQICFDDHKVWLFKYNETVKYAFSQGRNMVYPGPIDPYFLAFILIPEPHFPQNFDPWALITELIPSIFLHKILTEATLFISKYRIQNMLKWADEKNINFNFDCKL